MVYWTLEQDDKFIVIEQAFEEFCEADPKLSKLNSTNPGLKSKKYNEWRNQYGPAHDAATERFVDLFRGKILVAWVLRDNKENDDEVALPLEYWAHSLASLTLTTGKVEAFFLDEQHIHLANSRVVLHRKDWEEWISPAESSDKHKRPRRNRKHDVEAVANLKNSIEKVLAKARNKWPDPKKRPEIDAMARELERLAPADAQ